MIVMKRIMLAVLLYVNSAYSSNYQTLIPPISRSDSFEDIHFGINNGRTDIEAKVGIKANRKSPRAIAIKSPP